MMATDTKFIMSIMSGHHERHMTRFVNSCVFMRRRFASSKRSSSWASAAERAYTTGMPKESPRDTRFTRSMSCHDFWNSRHCHLHEEQHTAMASTATTIIQPIERGSCGASLMMPPMAKMGA